MPTTINQKTNANTQRIFTLGKLCKGAPKENNKVGANLEYFRFDEHQGDRDSENAKTLFHAHYGEKPQQVNILLCGETPVEVFDEWYTEFGSGYLRTKCNGVEKVAYFPSDGTKILHKGDPKFVDQPCQKNTEKGCKCAPSGVLRFYIEELFFGGYVDPMIMSTKAFDDISVIKSTLETQYNLVSKLGANLHFARFTLTRQQVEISVPAYGGKLGQRSQKMMWGVRIRPQQGWIQNEMKKVLHGQSQSFFMPTDTKLLPPAEQTIDLDQQQYLTLPETKFISEDNKATLEKLRIEHKWSSNAMKALLDNVGATRYGEVPLKKLDFLIQVITNSDLHSYWEKVGEDFEPF